jgi:hypothetical protein
MILYYEIVSSNKFRFGNLGSSVHLFGKERLFRKPFWRILGIFWSNLSAEAHSELDSEQMVLLSLSRTVLA